MRGQLVQFATGSCCSLHPHPSYYWVLCHSFSLGTYPTSLSVPTVWEGRYPCYWSEARVPIRTVHSPATVDSVEYKCDLGTSGSFLLDFNLDGTSLRSLQLFHHQIPDIPGTSLWSLRLNPNLTWAEHGI